MQTRNQDLRKIEETITQLAQMMQDMATLVLEQDESVQRIEQTAATTNTDIEAGCVEFSLASSFLGWRALLTYFASLDSSRHRKLSSLPELQEQNGMSASLFDLELVLNYSPPRFRWICFFVILAILIVVAVVVAVEVIKNQNKNK